jgi:hypothetical protein
MKQHKIKIRPLSEGIGLGSLRSPGGRHNDAAASFAPDKGFSGGPKIDSLVMRQAHAAYAPGSVGAELRARGSTMMIVGFRRFIVNMGTDLFVGLFSALVLTWSGLVAWEAGSVGTLQPVNTLIVMQDFMASMTWQMWLLAFVAVTAMTRSFKMIFLRA